MAIRNFGAYSIVGSNYNQNEEILLHFFDFSNSFKL